MLQARPRNPQRCQQHTPLKQPTRTRPSTNLLVVERIKRLDQRQTLGLRFVQCLLRLPDPATGVSVETSKCESSSSCREGAVRAGPRLRASRPPRTARARRPGPAAAAAAAAPAASALPPPPSSAPAPDAKHAPQHNATQHNTTHASQASSEP
eukprot:2707988-Rhodomonas_salina.2